VSLYVVDASVAIKWYIPEAHSEVASGLLDPDNELCATDLLSAEFGNVLRKKHRRRELTEAEVTSIVRALAGVPLEIYSSLELLEAALEIAMQTERTVYDSLYVALAVALDRTLVTADGPLVGALRETPLAGYVKHIREL
jgi:predicted nucleic acid-binding protein